MDLTPEDVLVFLDCFHNQHAVVHVYVVLIAVSVKHCIVLVHNTFNTACINN